MTAEQFLSAKLRRFSILDIGLVKAVYFLFGLLAYKVYAPLHQVDWWFYLILGIVATFPLTVHFFSFDGSFLEKGKAYLKHNAPAFQVLLAFTQVFFAFMLASLIPWLVSGNEWIYLALIVILAIKPMTRTVFW